MLSFYLALYHEKHETRYKIAPLLLAQTRQFLVNFHPYEHGASQFGSLDIWTSKFGDFKAIGLQIFDHG